MFDIEVTEDVIPGLDAWIQQVPLAVARALYAEAEGIMADSKEHYVPVDFGVLRDSGTVEEPVIEPTAEGTVISVTMGYGGAAAAYALAVHEHPSGFDPPSWQVAMATGHGVHFTVGGPKYLELPFNDAASHLDERLADRLAPLVAA